MFVRLEMPRATGGGGRERFFYIEHDDVDDGHGRGFWVLRIGGEDSRRLDRGTE